MTPREAVLLTRYVKACCPQQAMDKYTPDAWHDLLGDLDAAECKAAAAEVGKRQPFIAPAEIRAEVRKAREARLAREIIPAPPAHITDDARRYRAELEAGIRRIGNGFSLPQAIKGPVREGEPPEVWTEVRAGMPRALTKQEIALQQAADSRAERAGRGDEPSGDPEAEAS
jgi:ribosomal protein L13E